MLTNVYFQLIKLIKRLTIKYLFGAAMVILTELMAGY